MHYKHTEPCISAIFSLPRAPNCRLCTWTNVSHSVLSEAPALWVVKNTYFKHFVAGTDLTTSLKTAEYLSHSGFNTILDYSIESAHGNVDEVVDVLVEATRQSGKNPHTPFSCFKFTALASPHLLMRLSEIIAYSKKNPGFAPAEELNALMHSTNYPATVESMIAAAKARVSSGTAQLAQGEKLPKPFTQTTPLALTIHELENELLPFSRRLEKLGEAARTYNQKLLVDAEQSWFQDAIHFASRCLTTRYNKEQALVYNTYQMYLRSSLDKLTRDLTYAQNNGLFMGAKVVRGAYMDAEAKWAKERFGPDAPSPVHPTIEDTHQAYDSAITLMLDTVKQGKAAVVIASHNENSIASGSQGMAARNMPANHPQVHFGQLYGMCDHMSLALADAGHNVVKYVPFGPIEEVIPYLLRRITENRGFLASTKKEQSLMLAEICSRLGLPSPSRHVQAGNRPGESAHRPL